MPDNTAVVYASKGGAAALYAETVADVLVAAGHTVDVIDLADIRNPDLTAYQNVVLGTGVRIGMVYRAAKRFLRRDDLKGKRVAIFLASGIAIEDPALSKEKFLDPLVGRYAIEPVMCDAFPGKVPGADENTPDTLVPDRIRKWAEVLATRLRARD